MAISSVKHRLNARSGEGLGRGGGRGLAHVHPSTPVLPLLGSAFHPSSPPASNVHAHSSTEGSPRAVPPPSPPYSLCPPPPPPRALGRQPIDLLAGCPVLLRPQISAPLPPSRSAPPRPVPTAALAPPGPRPTPSARRTYPEQAVVHALPLRLPRVVHAQRDAVGKDDGRHDRLKVWVGAQAYRPAPRRAVLRHVTQLVVRARRAGLARRGGRSGRACWCGRSHGHGRGLRLRRRHHSCRLGAG